MRVKICGVTNPTDAAQAARCGADFVGVVLGDGPRAVDVENARQIIKVLPPIVQPVLVWRTAPVEELIAALDATASAWVQLRGQHPPGYLRRLLLERPWVHIIRVWEVTTPEAGQELTEYLRQVAGMGLRLDAVLLDAPPGGPHPGFERLGDISHTCHQRPPQVWCAGGLNPTNLRTAVGAGRYDGVDVSAGVETAPGVKDHDAVQRFIQTAKQLG